MANTGRVLLRLVGLVGGLTVITMFSLFIYSYRNYFFPLVPNIIICGFSYPTYTKLLVKLMNGLL